MIRIHINGTNNVIKIYYQQNNLNNNKLNKIKTYTYLSDSKFLHLLEFSFLFATVGYTQSDFFVFEILLSSRAKPKKTIIMVINETCFVCISTFGWHEM